MIIVNFSHPLPQSQISKVEQLTKTKVNEVINVLPQFDLDSGLKPQVEKMIGSAGLSWEQWKNDVLCCYPSLNFAAGIFSAMVFKEIGKMPPMIRTAPVTVGFTRQFEVVEILYF